MSDSLRTKRNYSYTPFFEHTPKTTAILLPYPLDTPFVSRDYKPMPPLWRIQELLELTDEHPSGLRYIKKDKPVNRLHKCTGYYLVSIDSEVYQAHRVVYYLRTGECPDSCSISHHSSNVEKDNRQELHKSWISRPHKRKEAWSWN